MSNNNHEEDSTSSKLADDTSIPRKKMRVDSSTSRGWSLAGLRTDHEALQEMGVSLLDSDDDVCETPVVLHQKAVKRKGDIENVNPNAPSAAPSPKRSPAPSTSRQRSPRTLDKAKTLQPTDQQLLETTLITEYLIDEETPLAQMTNYTPRASNRQAKCVTPLSTEKTTRQPCRSTTEYDDDSFDSLSDEMLLSVFRWLPRRSLVHCMLVCSRWYRVACDETLWARLDLGNKLLATNALGRVLDRKPVIVRLANSEISPWHPTGLASQSRLQYLDLSMAVIDIWTLNNLLKRCSLLKKLSLENVTVDSDTCMYIGKCQSLETLNLSMASGVTEEGVVYIMNGCPSILALNMAWCNLTEDALRSLVTKLPNRLQRLNMAGARQLTDSMVKSLVSRCPRLLELDLSDCALLQTPAADDVMQLQRLEHLALSRCYLLPPHVLTKFNAMPSLQYLDVWGMLQTASLNALRAALPAIQINQFMFSAIARPTVGTRRTSIWGLRTRD